MVVTMLEAQVPDQQASVLLEAFRRAGEALLPVIRESFLLRAAGSDGWRIMTVWESREALEEYRASVETPEGVRMFRVAGAEPTLTVFEVVGHAAQP